MTTLEKDIEQKLVKMVKRHGGRCPKWVSPGWSGVPDRLVLLPGGRIIFVETKRPKGSRVAALQKKWREWLQDLGFMVWHVYTEADLKALDVSISVLQSDRIRITEAAKAALDRMGAAAHGEVQWSRPGPCPITPEQFDAIYNDEEGEEDGK